MKDHREQRSEPPSLRGRNSGARDFDFLLGKWIVHHKRLKTRFSGADGWERFRGLCNVASILGGYGTVEENFIDPPEGFYHAVTIRCFDPHSDAWVVSQIDGRRPRLQDRLLTGRFRDGLGAFFSDEESEGRPIRVRFIWSNITATSARGQQAVSCDGGASWETNWTMEFERTRSEVSLGRFANRLVRQ